MRRHKNDPIIIRRWFEDMLFRSKQTGKLTESEVESLEQDMVGPILNQGWLRGDVSERLQHLFPNSYQLLFDDLHL